MSCHCSDWRECGVCDCHQRNNPDEYTECEGCQEELWIGGNEHVEVDGNKYCKDCVNDCEECNKPYPLDELNQDGICTDCEKQEKTKNGGSNE